MIQNISCSKCGAKMNPNPDSREFVCPYCDEVVYMWEEKKSPEPKPISTPVPQPLPTPNVNYSNSTNPKKDKSTTLVLCFFLGTIGAHHFYLGHTLKGVAYIILAVIFWPIPAALSLIDFITYLFRNENDF